MQTKGKRTTLLVCCVTVLVLATVAGLNRKFILTWYALGRQFESVGKNTQGYREYRHKRTGIVFVRLPAGTFWMGAQDDDPNGHNFDGWARDNEGPVYKVTLSSFLIAKCEVTAARWKTVMGMLPPFCKAEHLPADWINWNQCKAFCKKTGLSLPTEAQWEYACRAGTSGPFAGTGTLDEMGWYGKNSNRSLHPPGEKKPNQFGLYDMHGNASEFCEDAYVAGFYSFPMASGSDPLCKADSGYRVFRGGSYRDDYKGCRSAERDSTFATDEDPGYGFRPVFDPRRTRKER